MRPERIEQSGVEMVGTAPPELSIIIPARDEEACIEATLRAAHGRARHIVRSHELIVVDDGSTDRTLGRAAGLVREMPVTVLRLSRNFGKEQAIMAGLARARGAAVILLDADMQEPIDAIGAMVSRWREGWEMVYAVRAHRRDESRAKRALTRAFYGLVNLGAEVPIPADARDFRLLDRRVVDALLALPERTRFMKGLYGWVGFRSIAVPVELAPRAGGASKFGLAGLWRLAVTGLTAFTSWPLRVWTGVGLGVAILSLLYALFLAGRTILFGHPLAGWSTLAVGVFLLGGVQLFSIGILGEYLARVFAEVKGRPGYIVAEVRGRGAPDA
jgi:glycosyltransferase involved in cell wall biosynthesis